MPRKQRQGQVAGAAAGAFKDASRKQAKDAAAEQRAKKQRKLQKEVQKVVDQMNRRSAHRGRGAWQVLAGSLSSDSDSDSDSCQEQSSQRESAESEPARDEFIDSDLVDAVNDDATEEHDLSCPHGDGAEGEQDVAGGHLRTGRGVPALHGVGSDACSSIGPVLIGPQDMPHAVAHAQYVLAAKPLFQGSTCPPRLHCAPEYGLKAAAFAMPDWNEDTKAIQWDRLHVTGVCKVSGDSGSLEGQYVYFCFCNEVGRNAWNMCELYAGHNVPATNTSIISADCLHVQALPGLLGHDPKQYIDCAATQVFEDYSHDHNDDNDDSLLAQWPCFALGHVCRYKTKAKNPLELTQVGVLGSGSASSVGLVLAGRCRTCSGHKQCVHSRVWNLHNGHAHDANATHGLDGEHHPPVSEAHSFSMTQDKFDTMLARMCNADGSGLELKGWSQKRIPFDPAHCSSHLAAVQYNRCCLGQIYSDQEGLRDPYQLGVPNEDNHARDAGDQPINVHMHPGHEVPAQGLDSCVHEYKESTPRKPTFLLHPGGVIPNVRVYDCVIDGEVHLFDGADAGILRMSETVFLTHDLLQEFWDCSVRNRLTHRGWILSKINTWTRSISPVQLDPLREKNRKLVLEFLWTPSLPDLIFDALYDYVELLDVPYSKLIACQCKHDNTQNADFIICIYDNACKWLEYLLLRFPALHQTVHACIDALHAQGHKRCSPGYNHKLSTWTQHINAELNEQKNRKIKTLASCFPFMGQIHAMVKLRFHIAMMNLDQMACKHFMRPSSLPTHPTFVFDGTVVGLNRRFFCPKRDYEQPHDYDNKAKPKDLTMGCALKDRLMIPHQGHRQVLLSLVESSRAKNSGHCPHNEHCSSFVAWIRDCRPALQPFIHIQHTFKGDTQYCALTETSNLLLPLLLHWSSTAPETVLIPAPLIPVVDRMLAAQDGLETKDLEAVSHRSQILFNLFQFCKPNRNVASEEHMDTDPGHHALAIVPSLRALLTEMMTLCKLCFKSQSGPPDTQPWPRRQDCPPKPEFLHMVTTGTYFPGHPVIRTLSYSKHDYLNHMALQRRNEHNQAARAQAMQELHNLSTLRGVTCNKYKDRFSTRVTPGLFTAFCCGCSMCVGFELMDDVESPKTLFQVVALRAWTPKQHKAHETWLRDGTWEDPDVHVVSCLQVENDVSQPTGDDLPEDTGCLAAPVLPGRPMRTRRQTEQALTGLKHVQCLDMDPLRLTQLWKQPDDAMAFRPTWTDEQQQEFQAHCHNHLRSPTDHDHPKLTTLSRPKDSIQRHAWSSHQSLSIPDALCPTRATCGRHIRIEHNFPPALLDNVLNTLPDAIQSLQELSPTPVWDMLETVVQTMRTTSRNAQLEHTTMQIIVTPPCDQGLSQVATTHWDDVHVVSVVLEGTKTWQLLPCLDMQPEMIAPAESNQAPTCVPDLEAHGNWSQTVLQPGQALFVPAFMWHRVLSGPQGSVSVNFLRDPEMCNDD